MDAAPLTTAHELARDATHGTPQSVLAAAEKHRTAAGEFAKAAEGIEDSEALRVLNLLEQHHRRLAQIIASSSDKSSTEVRSDASEQHGDEQADVPPTTPSLPAEGLSQAHRHDAASLRPASRSPILRRPGRDMSSSIASNLATARGIPQNQQRRAQLPSSVPTKDVSQREQLRSVRQDSAAGGSLAAANLHRSSHKQNATSDSRDAKNVNPPDARSAKTEPSGNAQGDDAFQKFYSTFEGLLTKLSAPLAFAGLPLVAEETPDSVNRPAPLSRRQSTDATTPATSPDISKIFSKAALRAVKDDRGGLGVQESFFVVPNDGGSSNSYAGVLSRAERQARHHSLETPLEEGNGDAVMRRSTSAAEQMRSSQMPSKSTGEALRTSRKTTEELEIENDSLKQLTDNLSRRLYMWEKSAQSQSMALQQSIRNLQPPSRVAPEAGERNHPQHETEARELQEQLSAAQKELERYGRENEKLTAVVLRYRQRWEKLKEGARVRREGTPRGSDVQANNDDAGDVGET